MKIIRNLGRTKDVVVTLAFGGEYYNLWETHASNTWVEYCQKHDLGLIVIDHPLYSHLDENWKKAHWQKLLIGDYLSSNIVDINNVCFLDSDILINPNSPNIFDHYDSTTIALTSLRKNLPFSYDNVLRRLAFLRHTHYDKKYPLDSALFISVEDLYKYHNLPPMPDEACTGVIIFNPSNHARFFKDLFFKYDSSVQSITNGGEQTHLNFEIQSNFNVQWLSYKFQAIWPFEMALKYPFLYKSSFSSNIPLIIECIESCLYDNYFLHFAGSWHESKMWHNGPFFTDNSLCELEDYFKYKKQIVTGKPIGMIKP